MPAKLDRCINKVVSSGKTKNEAYGICSKSTGYRRGKAGKWFIKKHASEDWKEVQSFEDYEIHPSLGVRRKGREKPLKGRTWYGYPKVTLMRDGKKHEKRIHKLVAEHFIDNPDRKPIVNHKDADRKNHSIENLEWVDNSKNQKHRWETQKMGMKKEKYEREYGLSKVAKKKKTFDNIKCDGLGSSSAGVSCGKDKRGNKVFVYTHRARSKKYDKLSDIPKSRIDFIKSTG